MLKLFYMLFEINRVSWVFLTGLSWFPISFSSGTKATRPTSKRNLGREEGSRHHGACERGPREQTGRVRPEELVCQLHIALRTQDPHHHGGTPGDWLWNVIAWFCGCSASLRLQWTRWVFYLTVQFKAKAACNSRHQVISLKDTCNVTEHTWNNNYFLYF